MTLTRTPCELEKMSLFQDLKLKRRKVDSRCSSDGESVADTSTSSPDLVPPPSPTKMAETAQQQQQQQQQTTMATTTTTTATPSTILGIANPPPSPDSTPPQFQQHEPTVDKTAGRLEDSGVFDGGGGPLSVIKSLQSTTKRSHSPPIRPAPPFSPCHQPPRPHSSPGRQNVSPRASPVIKHTPLMITPTTTPSPPSSTGGHLNLNIINEPPTSSLTKQRGVIINQQSQSQSQLWRINGVKPELIGGNFATPFPNIKPELIGGNFGGTTTTCSTGNFQELKSPMGQRTGVTRQTPAVIMGEAGGVRTMIWSQPISPVDPVHPTTSQWSTVNSAVSNTEENAAQMLLNLGQDRMRSTRPSQSPINSLNMEQLWAQDVKQTQALNLSSPQQQQQQQIIFTPSPSQEIKPLTDSLTIQEQQQSNDNEEEQPMICMICEDKATGLHYGIITCEGCKGFFKRTVQNRRVYTCVADGNCEITKAQRNRCQYCRFKKCIEQGMVLQAVREDRMPGGRNSGAVYNLYKVKYKKHKKPSTKQQLPKQQQQQQQQQQEKTTLSSVQQHSTFNKCEQQQQHQQQQQQQQQYSTSVGDSSNQGMISSNLVNGQILKTALTNPSEVIRLRQRLDSAVSSSRDRTFSFEYSLSMIKTLIDCDEFHDIATLQNLNELLDHDNDLSEKLRKIGDSIVLKLVQWTKRLPFYLELPVEVHTRLLTHKWHELLVLTTSAYQAIQNNQVEQYTSLADADFNQEVESNLCTLQNCLRSMMGRDITIEQLRQDVGLMIEKITHVTLMFKQIKLTMEEYVCLKVITMLNEARPASNAGSNDLEIIHERYMTCLKVYTQHIYPQQTTRFQDLLVRLPEIQSAASLLLESKMFYVPFLLNSAIQR